MKSTLVFIIFFFQVFCVFENFYNKIVEEIITKSGSVEQSQYVGREVVFILVDPRPPVHTAIYLNTCCLYLVRWPPLFICLRHWYSVLDFLGDRILQQFSVSCSLKESLGKHLIEFLFIWPYYLVISTFSLLSVYFLSITIKASL